MSLFYPLYYELSSVFRVQAFILGTLDFGAFLSKHDE